MNLTHVQALFQMPVSHLHGVGPKIAAHLERLNIYTVQDLLFHLPIRYEDRSKITFINALRGGETALIEGEIVNSAVVGPKKNLVCQLKDETGTVEVRFFHFTPMQQQYLIKPKMRVRCYGEVRWDYRGKLEMMHPEIEKITLQTQESPLPNYLTAVYSTTKGLSQLTFRKMMKQILEWLKKSDPTDELLPHEILHHFHIGSTTEALLYLHQPPIDASLELLLAGKHPHQQKLAFEELVAHQLSLLKLRATICKHPAPILNVRQLLRDRLLQLLPFQLTSAQMRVLQELENDLQKNQPMLRLIQGDVGSGKTVVAALIAAQVIGDEFQVALMAPTEILAEQHLKNFKRWFEPLGVEIGLLVGSQNQKERHAMLEKIRTGEIKIIIGTHALFQDEVQFNQLALIVIDEQHRFGVHQRLALQAKATHQGYYPHQLIMTATPIPRTLAMTAYSDLDYSVIDELPPGRKPVQTVLIPNVRRHEILERVRNRCRMRQQAYWICTLIEDSEILQCQAAEATALSLKAALSELNVGLIHGRLKWDEKESIMQQFKEGSIDLLVATTVVEVGVDVPNANLMIIENPERLGLAQLHQLRGRVGRGSEESFCVLLYQGPLSDIARQRLSIMHDCCDGFEIAQKDLEMRGPGELLGTRQAGLMRFKIADILRDEHLIADVKKAGNWLIHNAPHTIEPLLERWIKGAEYYAQV